MRVRVLVEMDDGGRGVRAANALDSAMRAYNEKLRRAEPTAEIDFEVLGVVGWADAASVVAEEPSADEEHNVEPWSPTGHIDSPVSCKKCDRYLFIGADGEWQHVARQEPQGEPTDAETRDVLYFALRDAGEGRTTAEDLSRKLTAALRAAAAIGQEEGR